MKATHVRAIYYVKLGSVIKDIDVLTLKVELMLIKVYLREKCNKAYVSDSYLQEVAFLLVRPLLDTDKRTVKIAGRK